MLVEKLKSALRLAAVDRAGVALGLAPGLTLADARARVPTLRSVVYQPNADAALMAAVLKDFGRFSPVAAEDAPHGVVLDIAGCEHLFGGERGLCERARRRAAAFGLSARLATADTPQAARALTRYALARHGLKRRADETERALLRRLPVAALELSEREETALRRAGLKRLGDLDDRPRAPLAARFGADFPARLARVLGDEDVRITPHRPPAPCRVDRILVEPITEQADVERVLDDLLAEAVDRLDQVGQGGRAFAAGFWRADGAVRWIEARTGRPSRDAGAVARLFRERLAALSHPLEAGFGFDQMTLEVFDLEALAPVQRGLADEGPGAADLARLIDHLTARLGPQAVSCFRPQGSHLPERAERRLPAAVETSAEDDWAPLDPADPPLRPLHLFDPPQPVETNLAEAPDGYPRRFRWRRVEHHVVRAEGPERIAGEWWRAPSQRTRDYYRIEDRDGRRFWLFRQGLYGEADEPRWFIHGLFS